MSSLSFLNDTNLTKEQIEARSMLYVLTTADFFYSQDTIYDLCKRAGYKSVKRTKDGGVSYKAWTKKYHHENSAMTKERTLMEHAIASGNVELVAVVNALSEIRNDLSR